MAIMIEELEKSLNEPEFHGGQSPQEEAQVRLWQLFDFIAGEKNRHQQVKTSSERGASTCTSFSVSVQS